MTREEAIENLRRLQNLLFNDPYINTSTIITTCNIAIQALEQTRWIPVSEPPKEEGRYICDYGDCIDFGSYHDGHWYIQGAVAYMPLPQPYKRESEDAE